MSRIGSRIVEKSYGSGTLLDTVISWFLFGTVICPGSGAYLRGPYSVNVKIRKPGQCSDPHCSVALARNLFANPVYTTR